MTRTVLALMIVCLAIISVPAWADGPGVTIDTPAAALPGEGVWLEGTASGASLVRVYANNVPLLDAEVDAAGDWSNQVAFELADEYTLIVKPLDADGNPVAGIEATTTLTVGSTEVSSEPDVSAESPNMTDDEPSGDASPNLESSPPPPNPLVDETPAGASSPSVEQTPNAGESPSGTSSPNATSQPEEESTLSKVLGYALKGALGLVVSLIGIALLIWGVLKAIKSKDKPAGMLVGGGAPPSAPREPKLPQTMAYRRPEFGSLPLVAGETTEQKATERVVYNPAISDGDGRKWKVEVIGMPDAPAGTFHVDENGNLIVDGPKANVPSAGPPIQYHLRVTSWRELGPRKQVVWDHVFRITPN